MTKTNHLVCLSFGIDPLNWQSFFEISETAWCYGGHTLKLIISVGVIKIKPDEDFFFGHFERSLLGIGHR